MTYRAQLTADVYMPLNGQPQIVLSGSVMDIPDSVKLHPSHATVLSPAEAAGTLINNKPTPVRNVRSK